MSLSLLEVVAAVRARRASLSAETVGNLLLGVADQLIAVPREISAADVFLGEEGAVRLGAGRAADPERSERALRELLDALLGVASTATPALARIGRRPGGAGIESLLRELEAALIPVNRAAARRALNRLYRDAQRAAQAATLDVVAAQAWLKRSTPPSAPAPAVEFASPPPAPHETPIAALEVTPSRPRTLTRPPPLPDQRPTVETLTRPEPVLVRAAARAQSEAPVSEVLLPQLLVGTPRLGTFVAPVVHSVPAQLREPVLELVTDEATERTPEVASEPPAIVVTAPLPPCTLPVPEPPCIAPEPEEPSAELASVVADALAQNAEPELFSAEPELFSAEPELFSAEPESLDDEIMIVVDSELTPVPEGDVLELVEAEVGVAEAEFAPAEAEVLPAEAEAPPAEAEVVPERADAAPAEAEAPLDEAGFAGEPRWWSSPEPPELEAGAHPETFPSEPVLPEPAPAPIEAHPVEVPSFPELEMPPPRPVAAFEPTPLPELDPVAVEESRSAPAVPEPTPYDEAALEAAAAEYAAIAEVEPTPLPAESPIDQRDLAESGWTPAPEPIPVVAPTPEAPPPEPAPPRFPPRRSDVSELLRGFAVTEARSDRELCRDLKLLAGVDLTPFPGSTTPR